MLNEIEGSTPSTGTKGGNKNMLCIIAFIAMSAVNLLGMFFIAFAVTMVISLGCESSGVPIAFGVIVFVMQVIFYVLSLINC